MERRLELNRTLTPDVVPLDIDMPSLDGFQLIESLTDESAPKIVFVRGLARTSSRGDAHCHLSLDGCPW
jgi:CheY-like chemotaxis protein